MKKYIILFLIISSHLTFGQNKNLRAFIESYAKDNQFNGTVLVQKGTKTLYNSSFGLSDRRFNVPITNKTRYKIASITKAFTAVLILQLRDENKLELNHTISRYLPNYSGEAGTKVTIHQLLNHTSGMTQVDTISSINNALKYGLGYLQMPNTSDQLLHLFENDSLVNTPSENWDYNNFEYIVLGKIIETIYNKSYDEVLNEKILEPLLMQNTGILYSNDIVSNLASTYFTIDDSKKLVPDLPVYMENYYASGSLYSDAHDLLKFSNAIFSNSLIRKESLEMMLTPGINQYGYGVWIRGEGDFKIMERFGRIMGANAVWMQFLNKDVTIILLSNTNLTDLGKFANTIAKAVIMN